MSQTAESLMSLVEQKVIKNEPMSPAYWCEIALRINALKGELDNQIALLESQLVNIEAELMKQDLPAAKTKVMARSQIDYKKLLELKATDKRINEFIMLSKKRAMINEL